MRRVWPSIFLQSWMALVAMGHGLSAQVITRDNYYRFLPPPPRLVTQTRESAEFKVFGDRTSASFRDVLPLNGVDDERDRRALEVAARFAPVMRPNNFVVPIDPRALLGDTEPLISDLWVNGKLAASDTIRLSQPKVETSPISLQSSDSSPSRNDELIDRLLAARGPRATMSQTIPADADSDRVIYFDFPGSDRRSWRDTYKNAHLRSKLHVFVHPFVGRATRRDEYLFYLQFWFFYPFNDAVNAHEGDWEHINVQVTTRDRARTARVADSASLSAADIQRLLSGALATDSLVIARVEYCFHEMFTQLDYLALTSDEPLAVPKDAHRAWEDLDYLRDIVRKRVRVGNGRLATHPVVYIGGNHRGPDELFTLQPRFGGSLKRNSGASYPFPGTWRTVAGFGVTETVFGYAVPTMKTDSVIPWYDAISDRDFIAVRPEQLELLPDWEVIEAGFQTNRELKRAWAWLVLPTYFGFPVSASLGGGILAHADVGNISPTAPTLNEGWNHRGAGSYRTEYHPRIIRTPVSPNTPWTIVQNGWGILNVPFGLWGLMPGYNVGLIELMPWLNGAMHLVGAPPRRTFVQDQLPARFTSAGQGAVREFGGGEFAKLIPAPSGAIGMTSGHREAAVGPRFWFNLFFGERFSLENSYGWSRSDISYLAADPSTIHRMTGSLEMRQLTGGFRWDAGRIAHENSRVFLRGGYGWLWYRATDQRMDGVSLGPSPRHGGAIPPLLPSRDWLPNTLYGGAGWEWFTLRRYWLFGLLGTGVRAEYTEYGNRIRYASGNASNVARGDAALSLVFGW